MTTQLQPSPQRAPRRALRDAYWLGLSAWFRVGKTALSTVSNGFQTQTPWPGHTATWSDLEAYAQWLPRHVRWKSDPLGGVFDTFPTRGAVAAQFQDKGMFEDDCDGLAFLNAQNVTQFADDPRWVYIVTAILDPYTFPQDPLQYAAHVICVFRHQGVWRVASNDVIYPDPYASFAAAVQGNPFCATHPVLWAEARDANLRRIASGRRLDEIEARLAED